MSQALGEQVVAEFAHSQVALISPASQLPQHAPWDQQQRSLKNHSFKAGTG